MEHLEHFGQSNVELGTFIFHLNDILLCNNNNNKGLYFLLKEPRTTVRVYVCYIQ